jgi:hypothetical protein
MPLAIEIVKVFCATKIKKQTRPKNQLLVSPPLLRINGSDKACCYLHPKHPSDKLPAFGFLSYTLRYMLHKKDGHFLYQLT